MDHSFTCGATFHHFLENGFQRCGQDRYFLNSPADVTVAIEFRLLIIIYVAYPIKERAMNNKNTIIVYITYTNFFYIYH